MFPCRMIRSGRWSHACPCRWLILGTALSFVQAGVYAARPDLPIQGPAEPKPLSIEWIPDSEAGPLTSCSCESSELWLVDTRCLGCVRNRCGTFEGFKMSRLTCGRWEPSSHDEFVRTLPPDTLVCVFVDGNRIDPASAIERGRAMSRRMSSQRRLRFVIWSWPSDRIPGLVRDARVKTDRSDCETYYLGSWLSRLPANQQVSLVAYSLGGRIATGALQLLAGGCLSGNSLGIDPSGVPHPRTVLIGAAVPVGWLSPNSHHGLALAHSSGTLSIYNPRDIALRAFRLAMHDKRLAVVGHRPIASVALSGRLRQCDVSLAAGSSHKLHDYLNAGSLCLVRAYALWEPIH
jgi:hypothetical protein